jgi:hypothetical protein
MTITIRIISLLALALIVTAMITGSLYILAVGAILLWLLLDITLANLDRMARKILRRY